MRANLLKLCRPLNICNGSHFCFYFLHAKFLSSKYDVGRNHDTKCKAASLLFSLCLLSPKGSKEWNVLMQDVHRASGQPRKAQTMFQWKYDDFFFFFFCASVSPLPTELTVGNSTLKKEEMMSQQRARLNSSPLITPLTELWASRAAAWPKANLIIRAFWCHLDCD